MIRRFLPVIPRCMFKKSVSDPVLNLRNRIAELFDDGLPLERFDSVRVGRRRHDDECHNGDSGSRFLEAVVQT